MKTLLSCMWALTKVARRGRAGTARRAAETEEKSWYAQRCVISIYHAELSWQAQADARLAQEVEQGEGGEG